ncbi:winged helix-turn-helix transcriptional regulator [Lacticaseibacillus pantheris]|jgi:DNA-binding HxlR family transcriptional regulator|uniref:Transcriptional regulator n=1 Tax=Lacticaseibacillus pantheris DSM 15945 = JCM 12539 = NBRC 106106 TaxID=1423783 RepID=A0A0R1TZZ4_9LACO|nr:winged helix-turn-helix transcriptional regulator [Lacticaseibacillus pantheris]KRL84698.1 transcriptional regulator [Lacticaseibacillus pantheris DSM 15945 = JCM 12539 = NBRC 106106]WKF83942.1 winged helix-turn-helix transcriptional regulator [Lacticaseibacillus pantheris]
MTTYNIGVEATMDIIGGKWKTIILCHLRHGMMRTGELRRAIPAITQKMLTQQLRELENDGIVHREVYEQVPPRVEYSLTERGESLNQILSMLCTWGEENIDERRACGEDIQLVHRDDVALAPR